MPIDRRMDKENVMHLEWNEIIPFAATWMGLEFVILSEASQRKTNTVWYHLFVEYKKGGTKELTYKTEIELQM